MRKKILTCPSCGTEGTLVKEISKVICNECGAICKKDKNETSVEEPIFDGNTEIERGSLKMTGRCRSFLKGWGFIVGYDGREYFAHQSSILMAGFRQLFPGQEVEFDVDIVDPRGPRAINIQPGPLPDEQEPKSFRDDVITKEG